MKAATLRQLEKEIVASFLSKQHWIILWVFWAHSFVQLQNAKFKSFTVQNELSQNNSGLKCPAPPLRAGRKCSACRAKNRKDGHRSPFHSLCTLSSFSLSRTHSQRQAAEGSCWARLIRAGELWANPVRWLSQSADKQRENLVMHQCLTVSQVAGSASGASYSRPIHTWTEFTPTDPI